MNAWILITDSSRARLFEADLPRGQLRLLREFEHAQSRMKNAEIVTDRSGSLQKGAAHLPISVAEAPKHEEFERFARELALVLREGAERGDFEALAVAAPPRFLGEIRAHLGEPTKRFVFTSVDTDLVHLDERELTSRLGDTIRTLRGLVSDAAT